MSTLYAVAGYKFAWFGQRGCLDFFKGLIPCGFALGPQSAEIGHVLLDKALLSATQVLACNMVSSA
jgi:hypothetical protein